MRIFANFQVVQTVFSMNLLLFWASFCTILVGNFFLVITRLVQYTAPTDEEVLSFVLYFAAFIGSNVFFEKLQRLKDTVILFFG